MNTSILNIIKYNTRKSQNIVIVLLFENKSILIINIIALQKPWKNIQKQTIYHPQKAAFYLLYPKNDKAQVCFFINKKIKQAIRIYIIDLLNIISLYIKFPNRQVHIHDIYNLVNAQEISTNILVLEQKLVTSLHNKYIALSNFNLHHES